MLTDRIYTILKKLDSKKSYYTNSTELAQLLGVSSRTVKRDLKELLNILKDNGADICATNQGYKLLITDKELYLKFIDDNLNVSNEFNNKNQDKVKCAMELLLLNEYITQDEIANELYISKSYLSKIMADVKNILAEYEISLQNKPHYGYVLEGEEIKIRNSMVRYLTERKNDNSIVISKRLDGFNEVIYNELLKNIKSIFKELKIRKNDIEICYITRYIIISIFRIENNFQIKLDKDINISVDNNIILAAREIINKFKQKFNVDFSFEEIIYISYIIGNNKIEVKGESEDKSSIEKMVIYAISKIKNEYNIDFFRDSTLIKGLINHLYTSYSRYYLNVTLDNPLIDLIKSQYIEAYNYSILFSNSLSDEYNVNMTEEDIGYIALHFAASLERDIMNNNIKVIIICSSGLGTAELLKTRIIKTFSNISIVGVYPAYIVDSLELSDIDFIISTVNTKDLFIDKDIINVSPLLIDEDIEKINEHISRQRDFEYLQGLMSEELFFTHIDTNSKEEVIEIMCNNMVENNVISQETKEGILKREETSSTEINELVSIPHYITKDSKKSVLSIGILSKPILWDKTYVQLVFLGALDPQIKQNRKVFTMLFKLTQNTEKVRELVKIDNLRDFKKKLF